MFKTEKLVVFAVVVLALSGCSAAVASETAKSEAPTEVVASAEPSDSAEPVAAPITMEPVAPENQTEAQKAGFVDENDWYLRSIKSSWTGDMPTDDQLLGAAALACEGVQSGTAPEDISVVAGEGDDAFYNNRNTVNYAIMALCPV